MSTLEQLQSDFQDFILGKDGAHGAMAAHIGDRFGPGASERLAIYYDAYRKRLRASLDAAFEKTRLYLGDQRFGNLADNYVSAHPSRHSNLRWLGNNFPAFVAQALPDCQVGAELAALEWAVGLAFDAADAQSIGAADLKDVPPAAWGELVFALHPAAQIVKLETNAGAIWQALNDALPPPAAARLATPMSWLVWRLHHRPHLRPLDALEAQALDAIASGASFGAVCDTASGMGPVGGADEVPLTLRMAVHLQDWLAQGLLTPVPAVR